MGSGDGDCGCVLGHLKHSHVASPGVEQTGFDTECMVTGIAVNHLTQFWGGRREGGKDGYGGEDDEIF